MHTLLISIGVAGDVHPFIAVGRALARRGHEVTFASDEPYRAVVESAGLRFISLGVAPTLTSPRALRDLTHPMKASLRYLSDVVAPRLPAMFGVLDALARDHKPDFILAHHTALCAPWIAAKHRVPWGMAAVAPASWTSVDQPNVYPGMPDRDRYPRAFVKVGVVVGSWATARSTDPAFNRARHQLGLPPARRALFDEMFAGDLNIGLWSPHMRPAASDDKPRSHVAGFTWFDAASDDSWRAAVEPFLASGDAPVLVTMGTSVPHATRRVLGEAARACARVGARALLLAGKRECIPEALPEGVLAVPYAPMSEVLPRCALALHHGGLGTLSRCLRAGVPMICVPHLHDQFDNSARARRAGVSLTIDRQSASADTFADAIRRVTAQTSFRAAAQAFSAKIAEEDGGDRAAELIESLVAQRASESSVSPPGAPSLAS